MATAVEIRKTVATPRSHSTPLNRSSFFKSPSGVEKNPAPRAPAKP
jgi:hypothetical protein